MWVFIPFLVIVTCPIWGTCQKPFPSNWVDDIEVSLTRGTVIKVVERVLLYDTTEQLFFTTPDLLPPPKIKSEGGCADGATNKSCVFTNEVSVGLKDTLDLLILINKIISLKGVDETLPNKEELQAELVNDDIAEEEHGPPPEDVVLSAGSSWFKDINEILGARSLQSKDKTKKRDRRWLQALVKPALGMSALLGADDLLGAISSVFTNLGGIKNLFTNYRLMIPDSFKPFATLPRKISQLEKEMKQKYVHLLKHTETANLAVADLQNEIAQHKFDIVTIQDAYLQSEIAISDIIRLLFTSISYMIFFSAFEECRGNHLSPIFIPPALLTARLTEIQREMPDDLEFAIAIAGVQRYYSLPNARCIFDAQGGMVRVDIPLVRKGAKYSLFEVTPLQFGFDDKKCALHAPARLVIKDLVTNHVYPISDVMEERCRVSSGLCEVPLNAMDDAESFCLTTLLSGSTVEELKRNCKIECFSDTRPSITQLDDTTFIAIHTDTLTVECPDEVFNITDKIMYGNLRLNLKCNCKIFLQGKLVGRSGRRNCESVIKSSYEILLPPHMTTLQDVSFSPEVENTRFRHGSEIFNADFTPSRLVDENLEELPFSAYMSFVWNFLHSMLIAMLFFRMNGIVGAIATGVVNARLVNAGRDHYCKIPDDLYSIIYIILGLCVFNLLPAVILQIYKKIKFMWEEKVTLEAQRVLQMT